MDLGIAGRKAIVCASSRGLGRACAQALAAAGCEVVINGLDAGRLEATAAELSRTTGAKIIPVRADVASAEGQAALFAACPSPTSWSTTTPGRRRASTATSPARRCSRA
jgi:3-oxoacyl-[acyl-carrier protein] reductase